jgi:hypothetical protein
MYLLVRIIVCTVKFWQIVRKKSLDFVPLTLLSSLKNRFSSVFSWCWCVGCRTASRRARTCTARRATSPSRPTRGGAAAVAGAARSGAPPGSPTWSPPDRPAAAAPSRATQPSSQPVKSSSALRGLSWTAVVGRWNRTYIYRLLCGRNSGLQGMISQLLLFGTFDHQSLYDSPLTSQ